MIVNTKIIRTVLGIIGNVTSFALFASPMPTFYTILRKRSVEQFKPDPYIAAVMNCACWVFYALPFNTPNSLLVITINGLGLLFELIYLLIFFIFCDKKNRWKITIGLLIETIVMTGIVVSDLMLFHTHKSRSLYVGIYAMVFSIILYSSPLTIMRKVIKTKSVEYMPLCLSLAAFSNGIIWAVYALMPLDYFILISNGVGVILGAAQLILYATYYKSTPKKTNKPEAELEQVEVVVVSQTRTQPQPPPNP